MMAQDQLRDFLQRHDPKGSLTEARLQQLRAAILNEAMARGPSAQPSAFAALASPVARTAWPVSAMFLLILGFFVGQALPADQATYEGSYLGSSVWNSYMQSVQNGTQKGDE